MWVIIISLFFPLFTVFLGDKVRLNERHPSLRNKKSVTDRAMIAVREFTRWKNIHTKEAQKTVSVISLC